MHRIKVLSLTFAVALVVVASLAGGTERKLRVVTTIPDLTALPQAVAGDLADVETLTRGTQHPHEAEVRPTMMLNVRRADVPVENGLKHAAFTDITVNGADNPNI